MNINKSTQTPMQAPYGATLQPFDGPVSFTPAQPDRLNRLPAVSVITGLSRSSIYSLMNAGNFPASVRLSARAVGWKSSDLDRWIAERVKTGGQS